MAAVTGCLTANTNKGEAVTKEQVVGLAVRLFAIFLALYTLRQTGSLVVFARMSPPDYASLATVGVVTLILLLVAILLWVFPLTVAGNLIPNIKPERQTGKLDGGSIEVVAFTVMGLWVLASAIPDTFYWAVFAYRIKAMGVGSPGLTPDHIGYMVATAVELAIGLWLLFGSKGLIGIIRRARQAGA
jgi:hypothetical protein